jgi:hypothetical protein
MIKINSVILFCLLLFPLGLIAQKSSVSISGIIKNKATNQALPFVNVVLKKAADSSFVSGTISNINGLFTIADAKPSDYIIEVSYIGYSNYSSPLFVGSNSEFIDISCAKSPSILLSSLLNN